MTSTQQHALLASYSRGELSRRKLAQALGRDVSPADAIILLADADLPLPHPQSPADAPGPKLLRQILANQKSTHG